VKGGAALGRPGNAASRQLPGNPPRGLLQGFDYFRKVFFIHLRKRAADTKRSREESNKREEDK